MTWVLDASAILCWLFDEPGAERMRDILAGTDPTLIHAVNLVEVSYFLVRRGELALRVGMERVEAAGVKVARDMDDALLAAATQVKAHQAPVALGDAFAVALAVQRQATLLTTDRGELQKVADAGICSIEFLR